MGPVSEQGGDAASQSRGMGTGTRAREQVDWFVGGFLSREVERPRCGHRRRGWTGRHRVLRGARRVHPLLLECLCRLPRADTGRLRAGSRPRPRAARPWALPLVAGFGALLGAVLVFRIAPEAEGHGTDAAISAVHHNPRGVRFRVGHRQDRRLGAHHRLGWLGWPRGTDRPDQRRVRLAARPHARSRTRRRPHRRGDGHRFGHRSHLRRAARGGRAGVGDPLPRRLRPGSAAAVFHRLGG